MPVPRNVWQDTAVSMPAARAPADHVPGLGSVEAAAAETSAIAGHGLEEGSRGVGAEACHGRVGDEVGIEGVVAGHPVNFAALLGQADVEAVLLAEEVADVERKGRADPREGIDHQRDQGAVSLAGEGVLGNAGEQDAGLFDGEHGRAADPDAVRGSANVCGGAGRQDLAQDQPVEELAETGELLLDGGGRDVRGAAFDPGGDVDGLDPGELADAGGLLAPGKETGRGAGIGRARVGIAELRREELEVAL